MGRKKQMQEATPMQRGGSSFQRERGWLRPGTKTKEAKEREPAAERKEPKALALTLPFVHCEFLMV